MLSFKYRETACSKLLIFANLNRTNQTFFTGETVGELHLPLFEIGSIVTWSVNQ